MNIPQADEILSTPVMNVIGALRTYAQRVQFFLGVPNTLMIGVLFYRDSPLIQQFVPTVYHWVALILFGIVPAAILIDRTLLHPAQITYNAHQGSDEDRNPGYKYTLKAYNRVEDLHDRLDELEGGGENDGSDGG